MADIQEFTIPVIAFLASIILVQLIARNRHKTRLPPSPTSLPIIGHMHHLGPIPHQAFHKLSLKYGPLIYFFIGSKPSLLASSPELAKEILKTHESNFMSRPKVANLDYLTYGSADFATIPYGPYWKFMKKLCMTELLGTRTLEQFLPIRRREINRFLNFLLKKAATGEAVNVGGELMRLTNNIISSMLLRTRCSDMESDADEVRKMVKELNELGAKFNFSDSFWFCKHIDLQGFGKRLKEARDKYDAMIERVIKEHEEERKKDVKDRGDVVKDLLDILLDIYEDESAEIRLTRENVKAFIMVFISEWNDEFCYIVPT
ncbi:3 9-dihydroxypterocarpan 6A-monooxygenase-like [Tripterygium wilfordii]|uniref:3 9-dihydroxypterocarpan 6A-monooxygenase-like n=1 Tax=Tripterygium wilfordii TaxID=458696 RepID=A0A7J7CXY7_TRIWF|nr:3 9-dihydroxypterocarpan 6A-monooxygenase-like [Tripterygium wilfordii]